MNESRKKIPLPPDTRSAGLALYRMLTRAVMLVDRWQARRQALRQYFGVSRHTLFDIGLTEADLACAACGKCDGPLRVHTA